MSCSRFSRIATVSYTHLDVYKRQGYHIEAEDGEIGHVAGFLVDDETWAIRYIEAVSYTHLDVYKRQELNTATEQ